MSRPPFLSCDSVEPLVSWKIALPPGADAHAFARGLLDAGEETEVFAIDAIQTAAVTAPNGRTCLDKSPDEPLPLAAAFYGEAGSVVVETRVSFRDAGGKIKAERHSDAGALLTRLVPSADAAWLRRFAASHPFVAPWSTTADGATTFTLAFWTSLFLDDQDVTVFQENRGRLLVLRTRLAALAREYDAELLAPVF